MKKWVVLIIVSLTLFTVSLGVMANQSIVKIAVPTDPDNFDPTKSVAAATAEIAFNIYEGLVKSNPDGQVVGALATDWEIDESNTEYTFYLREAYFHNGQQVTPEDVVNALNRARDPQISQRAGNFEAIDSVSATGNLIKIKLSEPYAPLLFELTELAAVVYPKSATNLDNNPIGTGPYKFVEWRPNQHIKLVQFDQYWSGADPYYEEVYFNIMPDTNSQVLSIRTGDIDIVPRLDASFLHQVESNSNITVLSAPMNLVQILAVNNNHPALSDLRVRQALTMAINREEIIYGAAWGQGEPIYTGFSPAMPEFHNDQLANVLPYDPEKAKELLAEAGHENLKLTFQLPSAYSLHVHTGEIIAEQLKKVGIDIEIQMIEWGTWLERVYTQRDYDLSITGLTGKLDPHTILSRYGSSNSRNFTNFNSQKFDRLIEEGIKASPEERPDIYKAAQKILTEEVGGIYIMDPHAITVTRNHIQGWLDYPVYVIDVAALYE